MTRAFINQCISKHAANDLTPAEAAMTKLWATEVQDGSSTDASSSSGDTDTPEHPIGRAFADARVTRMYGGTSEIMKSIVAKEILA